MPLTRITKQLFVPITFFGEATLVSVVFTASFLEEGDKFCTYSSVDRTNGWKALVRQGHERYEHITIGKWVRSIFFYMYDIRYDIVVIMYATICHTIYDKHQNIWHYNLSQWT